MLINGYVYSSDEDIKAQQKINTLIELFKAKNGPLTLKNVLNDPQKTPLSCNTICGEALQNAIASGDANRVRTLLQEGCSVNSLHTLPEAHAAYVSSFTDTEEHNIRIFQRCTPTWAAANLCKGDQCPIINQMLLNKGGVSKRLLRVEMLTKSYLSKNHASYKKNGQYHSDIYDIALDEKDVRLTMHLWINKLLRRY